MLVGIRALRTSTIKPLIETIQARGFLSMLLGTHHFGSIWYMSIASRTCLDLAGQYSGLPQTACTRTHVGCLALVKQGNSYSAWTMPQAQVLAPVITEGRFRLSVAASLRHSWAYSSLRCSWQKVSVRLTISSNLACICFGTRSALFWSCRSPSSSCCDCELL